MQENERLTKQHAAEMDTLKSEQKTVKEEMERNHRAEFNRVQRIYENARNDLTVTREKDKKEYKQFILDAVGKGLTDYATKNRKEMDEFHQEIVDKLNCRYFLRKNIRE